jgi:fructosamine-3-kinase
MREQTRPEVFYARRRFSYQTAESTEQQQQTAQATGNIDEVLNQVTENYEAHVYDFVTGYWGDGRSF